MAQPVEIRVARAAEVVDLRHAVLRAGLPRETAIFPGDDDPAARHFVATLDGRIVGCVTLHLNNWEVQPAWQLRGMAVEPPLQRSGLGARLLETAERSVRDDSPTLLLWCNARVPAAAFYLKHGWQIVSAEFDVPTAGPHLKMLKQLRASVR